MPPQDTNIVFVIGSVKLIIGICTIFIGLLAIIWRGKAEMVGTVKKQLDPFRNMAHAVTEIQTILKDRLGVINFMHSMIEAGESPLRPTKYGAQLIKESGLEKILDSNKENLCTKLKASLKEGYTEYDVQESARNILVSLRDDPMMKPVKEYIYNHPMDMEIILRAGDYGCGMISLMNRAKQQVTKSAFLATLKIVITPNKA